MTECVYERRRVRSQSLGANGPSRGILMHSQCESASLVKQYLQRGWLWASGICRGGGSRPFSVERYRAQLVGAGRRPSTRLAKGGGDGSKLKEKCRSKKLVGLIRNARAWRGYDGRP